LRQAVTLLAAIMKHLTILNLLLACFLTSFTQDINSIKSEQECLAFIRKNIQDFKGFYFDTLFTKEDIKRLNITDPYKNWGKFDFNTDGKPDLYFVGLRKAPYGGYEALLYLSCPNGTYKLFHLIRSMYGSFRPLLFSRKSAAHNLLFLYQIYPYERLKTDSIVASKQAFYPKGIKVIDTIAYSNGYLINYSKTSSQLTFDSLIYSTNGGAILKIYRNGTAQYLETQGDFQYTHGFEIKQTDFSLLKEMVTEIDLKSTPLRHSAGGWTDLTSVKLQIFNKTQKVEISDYGMSSTFTLMAIYDIIDSILRTMEL
jgi:hypothetical protein